MPGLATARRLSTENIVQSPPSVYGVKPYLTRSAQRLRRPYWSWVCRLREFRCKRWRRIASSLNSAPAVVRPLASRFAGAPGFHRINHARDMGCSPHRRGATRGARIQQLW